ncbi:MAG: glycoside hydrolase family 3 C-terminal domain-containing protein, partial [Cyanobium sp.]|nr:glycoside hydrolase family 3 C-terminal domain-containing protein [Cyanobium sp.]
CDAAVLVLGLDWRLEGEHIHPADIAPILALMPPPRWLGRLLGRRLLERGWRPLARLIAWITSHAPEPRGGDFAAGDRTDLSLPPAQVALIRAVAAANPRTVVVLMGGGAILTGDWLAQVPGLLLLWYPGQEGGRALAEVLLGQLSPSGRLPLTLPQQQEQLPPFDPRARWVVYDLWHGYRRLQRQGERAAFPFGFGLSYSRFESGAPQLVRPPDAAAIRAGEQQALVVAVEVCNRGGMAAAEVLQLYLEPPGRRVERPRRSLVAFARMPLQPGECRRLELPVPLRRLAFFDTDRDGFALEPGLHRLVLARHCDDAGQACEADLPEAFLGP